MYIHCNAEGPGPAYTAVTLDDVSDDRPTPIRPIRVEAALWEAFGRLVGPRNRSAVIREFIRWYVRERGAQLPKRPPSPEQARALGIDD